MVTGYGPIERLVRLWVPVGFFLVLALFPFYWMAITTFKTTQDLHNTENNPYLFKIRRHCGTLPCCSKIPNTCNGW